MSFEFDTEDFDDEGERVTSSAFWSEFLGVDGEVELTVEDVL